jgi:DNA-3-methyladenine glycosylase
MKLQRNFYTGSDVLSLSRQLLGKCLCSRMPDGYCSGIISELEAYNGIEDKASHAWGGRRTPRNEAMYAEGGIAYVYLCYGIHALFNIVTGPENIPHAILIRAIRPVTGIEIMEKRRKQKAGMKGFCTGPGKISQAMGISLIHNTCSLLGDTIWLEDNYMDIRESDIRTGTRIGIDYAGDDALLPYRFWLEI